MRTLQAAAKAEPKKAAAKPAPKPAEKATKVAKAKATTKIVKKSIAKKQSKVRKNVHFFRPKTLKQARKPMYPRKAIAKNPLLDKSQQSACYVCFQVVMRSYSRTQPTAAEHWCSRSDSV